VSPKIGSLLDLLPRLNTPAFRALPTHVQAEVKLLRKGYRPIAPGELDDVARLPKVIEDLAIEQRIVASTVADVHKAQSDLGGKLLPLIEAIDKRLDEHQSQLSHHEKRLDAHDIQLGTHARKHVDVVTEITGIHQRLVVVETHVTKRKRRKGK